MTKCSSLFKIAAYNKDYLDALANGEEGGEETEEDRGIPLFSK